MRRSFEIAPFVELFFASYWPGKGAVSLLSVMSPEWVGAIARYHGAT